MKRREFSKALASWTTLAGTAALAQPQAQPPGAAPVEGKHYIRVDPPVPAAAEGKIEVIEFFWYGCPHCFAFEPILQSWYLKLPADVLFKRVPVAFRQEPFVAHQKLFYTLEALGQVGSLHRKVFDECHLNKEPNDHAPRLANAEQIGAFAQKNGLDKAQFMSVFNSFAVSTKANQAQKLSTAYKIDGVPALGVQGRYFTSGSQAGDMNRALEVTEYLIAKVRTGK